MTRAQASSPGAAAGQTVRSRVANSRWARTAAMPQRIRAIARINARQIGASFRWLAQSREHTNFTYELSDLNRVHLSWWVSLVSGHSVAESREAIEELASDRWLIDHVRVATEGAGRSGLYDKEARFGRRLGWYALVRLTRPELVIETGTDKGLGALAIARALQRNGTGRLITMDINPDAGQLLRDFEGPWDIEIGDSIQLLSSVDEPVNMFIHDSLHTSAHEAAELSAIQDRLASSALTISDNSHVTDVLPTWAETHDKRFLFFAEKPRDHWYPGGGIGAAW